MRAPIQSKCNIHPRAEEEPNWDWASEGGKFGGKFTKKDTNFLEYVLVWWWHPCFATLCWCYVIEMFVLWGDHLLARSPSISLVENLLLRGKSPGSKTRTKAERGGVKSDFHNGCFPLTRPDDGIETADWIGGTLIGGDSLTRKIGEWFFQKRIRGFLSLVVFSSFRSGISFEFEQFARHNRLFYVLALVLLGGRKEAFCWWFRFILLCHPFKRNCIQNLIVLKSNSENNHYLIQTKISHIKWPIENKKDNF